jgi:predicted alpha/beta hydrolase
MQNVVRSIPTSGPAVQITLEAADGYRLGARLFAPAATRARGTVLVHGATAVPQRYYARFAAYLASRGLRVLTYDYRGVGASRPERLRGFEATMTDWARLDAAAAHAWVRRHHAGDPLVVVGHSFGGQLIGLLDDVRDDAAGAVLVASQLGYVGHWSALERLRLELLMRGVLPALTAAYGYLPGWAGLNNDLPAGVAREWSRWCLHPGYVTGHHDDAAARFARFDRPTLLYSFSDDDFAPRRAVDALARALSGAELDHRTLTPMDVGHPVGHFGFFRARVGTPPLWREAGEWVDAVVRGESPPRERRVAFITAAEVAADLGLPR